MSKSNINIQDGFLFQNLKEARIMHVHLNNGGKLVGRLKRFDRFAVVIENDYQETLVYKHAISMIHPTADDSHR